MTEKASFQGKKEVIRERFNKYTRKAFEVLPELDDPKILDIGCGTGVPTMELARLSNGEITGVDIDRSSIGLLHRKIEEAELSDRVKTIRCSITDMEFLDNSFDVIWSEGSIYVIGFKRGLKEWRRFLKLGGFLIVHDEQGDIEEKLGIISDCEYDLLDHFELGLELWRAEYFIPLEKLVKETRNKGVYDPELIKALRDAQEELDFFKNSPQRCASMFFIMRKK